MTRRAMMFVRQVSTGETALARRGAKGTVWVQFDRFDHPQSHGWHLYPRHAFVRRVDRPKKKRDARYIWIDEAATLPNVFPVPTAPIHTRPKGIEGGRCNRTACQKTPALWYNHGSLAWYCEECAIWIGQDAFNLRDWEQNFEPKCGHPMFETREMMEKRKQND